MEQTEKDWAQVEHASTMDEKVASTAQILDPDADLTPEEKVAKVSIASRHADQGTDINDRTERCCRRST